MSYTTITGMRSARYPLQGAGVAFSPVASRPIAIPSSMPFQRVPGGVNIPGGVNVPGRYEPPKKYRPPKKYSMPGGGGLPGGGGVYLQSPLGACPCCPGSCAGVGQNETSSQAGVPGILLSVALIGGLLWMATRGKATATT